MGIVLIYFIIFLLLLIIIALIVFLYLRKLGHKKAAIIVSGLIFYFVFSCFFCNYIDEFFYFKSDAKEDLKLANVDLKDDFEIIDNKVFGFPERYQWTKLKISINDKNRLISEIKNSKFFMKVNESRPLFHKMMDKNSKKIESNYFYNNSYIREVYSKVDGYVGLSVNIVLKEKSNEILFTNTED
jgi:hypothetical protein